MKNKPLHLRFTHAACTWMALAGLVVGVHAVPYASKLSNQGGTISFLLNEPADNVKLVYNNGATTVNLGALAKGSFSTNVAVAGAWQIVVSRSAPGGWVQTSDDANILIYFNSPRGVAVNRNPASPFFGRVYVANSASGTVGTNVTGTVTRSVGDGIYVLNADQSDAVGQGNTALNAGLSFASSISASPYRVSVGEDGNLYVCDWSDPTGNLLVTDPDVSAGSGKPVFRPLVTPPGGTNGMIPITTLNTHGSIAAAVVRGSLAQGTLTVFAVDEDLQTDRDLAASVEMNSLWRWDVGAGPLPSDAEAVQPKLVTPSVAYVSQTMDLDRGPDGKLYLLDNRSAGKESLLQVVDESGTVLFDSKNASLDLGSGTDLLADSRAIAISSDGKYMATLRNTNQVIVTPLVDGLPDLANLARFSAFGVTASARDIDFDAAGNLHIVSSGYARYRVFAPGGSTVATTGSDGTFTVTTPPAVITVAATIDTAAEGGAAGEFTFTRTGDTSKALAIGYTLSGTAENGVDYATLSGTLNMAAGATTATLAVTATDDALSEPVETVVLAVAGGANYSSGTPGSATVFIVDNDRPEVTIVTAQPTAYERTLGDYMTYRLVRAGDTNADLNVNLTYSGTAATADFTGPAAVEIPPGVREQTFQVSPVDNSVLDGDRTVIATVAAGNGYTVGAASSATTTIIDDELPSEAGKVLFADALSTDTSANWTVKFAANNDVDDKDVEFGFDLANDLIPAAPNGSGKALKLTVNKFDPTSFGAAGVNVYAGPAFSGDYALRFDMYIQVNATAATTEHVLFGLNHSGDKVNWARYSGGSVVVPANDIDGLWFSIVADTYLGNYLYTGAGADAPALQLANFSATAFSDVFKYPPFNFGDSGIGGAPANNSTSETKNWVNVEVKQVGNVVTLSIDKTVMCVWQNATPYKSGKIMLGYNDGYDSIGNVGAAYFSNVRVIDLTTAPPEKPQITGIQAGLNAVQIAFSSSTGTASDFKVQAAAALGGAFQDTAATIQSAGAGKFTATVTLGAEPIRFFRIKR